MDPLADRVVLRFSARKKRISVDAIVSFKVDGKTFEGKLKDSKWMGASKMSYTWKALKGNQTVTTEGLPKDLKVLSDVAYRHRL